MSTLDPLTVALDPGIQLIEANAGTGKTHALTTLYTRLLVDCDFDVSQIVAVTFTEAATKELRDRVRGALRKAAVALANEDTSHPLAARWIADGNRERAAADLELAILSFDQAQIFTIHGFAQRLLRDFAFETGERFESEFLGDPALLMEEITADFWRTRICTPSTLPALLAETGALNTTGLAKLLAERLKHDQLVILPQENRPCAELEMEIRAALQQLANYGEQSHEAGLGYLEPLMKSAFTSQMDAIRSGFRALRDGREIDSILEFSALLALAPDALLETKDARRKEVLQPPAFCQEVQRIVDLAAAWAIRIRHEFLHWAESQFRRRKHEAGVLTFDDLLHRLRDALKSEKGDALRSIASSRYGAALIDEFQDTDPVQYEALRSLFSAPHHRLLFIGDPKQAIYGFRGADVYTYLRARENAATRHSLLANWRSEPGLISAVNAFFDSPDAFGSVPIRFSGSTPPPHQKNGFKTLEPNPAPMRIRYLEAETPLPKTQATPLVMQAVAADVAALLNSNEQRGGKPVRAADIAVLLRSNRQVAQLQEVLRAHGVRCVQQTQASVFETEEADEMEALLAALSAPTRTGNLQAALSTRLLGWNAEEVARLNEDDLLWQQCLDEFSLWHDVWAEKGFLAMFRQLLADKAAYQRLTPQLGGDRKLTNYLHLAELLQGAANEEQLPPEALTNWFRRYRAAATKDAEDQQIRLESDEDAVRLVTIHKSKGLEFPIVFLPFLWDAADPSKARQRAGAIFTDPQTERPMLDFGGDPVNEAAALEHEMAEALRLAYVALTRAENRCYVYAGDFAVKGESALNHLVAHRKAGDLKTKLADLAESSGGSIRMETLSAPGTDNVLIREALDGDHPALAARHFSGNIIQSELLTSFSRLKGHREESPDRDAPFTPIPTESTGYAETIHGLEKGIRPGYFFHEVMETMDFRNPSALSALVDDKLEKHGLAPSPARDAIVSMLSHLLDLPFPRAGKLSELSHRDRLSETEFWMPVSRLTPQKLRNAFHMERPEHAGAVPAEFPERIGRIRFRPVEGYLRGVIDLLVRWGGRYYILDWKSNWLGPTLDHYTPERLEQAMTENMYHLQYHLYSVAAHRFLKKRLAGYDYDRDFGGVFYVFLRGVNPDRPEACLYHDRPSQALIQALEGAIS